MGDSDEVLTADEAATLLKVATPTVLKESREGRLPGVKIGREWRYSRTALLAHLRQYPPPVAADDTEEDADPTAQEAVPASGAAEGGASPTSARPQRPTGK